MRDRVGERDLWGDGDGDGDGSAISVGFGLN